MEPTIFSPEVYIDLRGSFRELFCSDKICRHKFIQQNISTNHMNVFRGMHYQYHHPQGKLVTVLSGGVIDYYIDLRTWSKDYGILQNTVLTEDNKLSLWIPPKFAHGFLSIANNTTFLYNVFDNHRDEKDEISINPHSISSLENTIFIQGWNKTPIMSDKDKNGLSWSEAPKYD